MADPKNLPPGNPNNSTTDPRVIWEDGTWAIIEAGDCWDGLARSKTRDNPGDAVAATWDPALTVMPGPNSVSGKKLVKVKLTDLLAHPLVQAPAGKLPTAKDWSKSPVAPPSPFKPKPWPVKEIPEFPHVCRVCGGRFYQGLSKTIHEATEHSPLAGACPGPTKAQKGLRA